MHIDQRKFVILRELVELEEYITSETLAKIVGVSSRTVREDITVLSRELSEVDIEIKARSGKGYKLVAADKPHARAYLSSLQQDHDSVPVSPAERTAYLLETLLFSEDWVTYDDLADPIYVSRSTIEKALGPVELWLAAHNLTLMKKPAAGIRLADEELTRRYALVNFLVEHYHQNPTATWNILYRRVPGLASLQEAVRAVYAERDGFFPDSSFTHLIFYLAVSIYRLCHGHLISHIGTASGAVPSAFFIDLLEKESGCSLNDAEQAALGQYLQQTHYGKVDVVEAEHEELLSWIKETLLFLKQKKLLDVCEDEELEHSLLTYLQAQLHRHTPKVLVKNPSIRAIKAQYPQVLEAAVRFSEIFTADYQLSFTEDEIGYLALYLCAAIERKKLHESRHPRRVVILCSSGVGGSQLLMVKIKRYFPELIVSGVYPAYQLDKALKDKPDFIISTIPLPETSVPVLIVSHLLNWDDFAGIRDYMDGVRSPFTMGESKVLHTLFDPDLFCSGIEADDREAVIRILCQCLIDIGRANADFTEAVLNRESLFSTAIGNMVAIPHGMPDQAVGSHITIGILKRPILWGKEKVQLVFLLNLVDGDSMPRIYEELFDTIHQKDKVHQLIKAKTYQQFIERI